MRRWLVAAVWIAVLSVGSESSFASSWWLMCDWCERAADFEQRATSAPGDRAAVYVTNRESNETRKYDKELIVDDLVNGTQYTVVVTSASLPEIEKLAFERAVENANTSFVEISRDELAGIYGGLGNESSVIGDFSGGSIDGRLIGAVIVRLGELGLFPSGLTVNTEAGTDIENVGAGTTIRVADVVIQINYPDGSMISFRERGRDGEHDLFAVTDAHGAELPLKGSAENRAINPSVFTHRSFSFGGPEVQEYASRLVTYLEFKDVEPCSATTNSVGEDTYVTVSCQAP